MKNMAVKCINFVLPAKILWANTSTPHDRHGPDVKGPFLF